MMFCNIRFFMIKSYKNNISSLILPRRLIFNLDSLKINSFKESRKNVLNSIPDVPAFKEEMKIKCNKDIDHLIFIEDFKKMLGVTENEDDLFLLKNMLKKFSSQSNMIRFSSYKLGPQILRLYHILNKPEDAMNLAKDPTFNWLFTEITSFILLSDMLFRNEMFDTVIELTHVIINAQLKGKKFPPNLIILYFASCHKLNTSESLEKASALWEILKQAEFRCPLRGVWFFSHLAIKQNQPDFALKIVSTTKPFPIGNNIKVLALSLTRQFNDVFLLLQEWLLKDVPHSDANNFITKDTLEFIEKIFKDSSEENYKKFERIKAELLEHNMVNTNDLESYLYEEINYSKQKQIVNNL